ncbi:MAG: hypothetical protein MUC63_00595 [Planctomycetes bacterium]|nr:hypothetical protein [Planctomycetota bacterium]
MEDKDVQDLRKRLFSDVEEEKPQPQTGLLDLFKANVGGSTEEAEAPEEEAGESGAPPAPASVPPSTSLTEEEREALTLREIKLLIAEYRLRIAESERRLAELRYRLAGLETEYRAVIGEPVSPLPPPPPPMPAPAPAAPEPPPAAAAPARAVRPRPRAWDDSGTISLEEAAWRILTEQGKSLAPWRVVAAVKRHGFRRAFTEEALVKECRGSARLGISAGGNIYLK